VAQSVRLEFKPQYPSPPHIHKEKLTKLTGRVTQVVEHLPSKCEALNSNPSTTKKQKQKQKNLPNRTLEICPDYCASQENYQIGRTAVQDQPGKSLQDPHLNKCQVHICNSSYAGGLPR
jgi:hypothetical protein